MACPCGTGKGYERCCRPVIEREGRAARAETVMRSRYSAFALGEVAHLLRTWHPTTRPAEVRIRPGQEWTGLTVVSTAAGGLLDTEGTVQFRARYRIGGVERELRETSRFVKVDGSWLYLDADDAALRTDSRSIES